MYRPASPTTAYLTFACPPEDESGRRAPIDAESWMAAFPVVAALIERTAREADWSQARWAQFDIVRLKRWSEDRVALQAWERSERPIIEHAQRWSSHFSAPLAWPGWAQSLVVPRLSRTAWLRERMTRPARYVPYGSETVRRSAGQHM